MPENLKSHDGPNALTSRIAMEWVVRRDRGLDPEEDRKLGVWLGASRTNREEFTRALDCWNRLDQLQRIQSLANDTDAVVARAKVRARSRKRLYTCVAGLAAALAVALSLFNSRPASPAEPAAVAVLPKEMYQVLESTARRLTLSDGSFVELNGDSRVEIDFTPEARRVNLLVGEAQFFVAKDQQRPFLVTAQGVTVRAVGTAFNVRLGSSSVEVLVTEGKILLQRPPPTNAPSSSGETGPSVVAGELAVVSTGSSEAPISIGKAGPLEIDQALAWQKTRLVFDRTPLSEVIAAFNRYNTHQLVLGSPELRSRTLSGVFRADNMDGFLRLLEISVDVGSERRSDRETVLVPAR